MPRQYLPTRVANLGLASLFSLFVGGTILIFIGANSLGSKSAQNATVSRVNVSKNDFVFQLGARYGIQTWLAVVGVGFGLLSYGFFEAYYHLFDWWCTQQALREPGLDYARYLNSQPRAPLSYAVHGFHVFTTLRYLLTSICIAASIGYKFGITQSFITVNETINAEHLYVLGTFPGAARLYDSPFDMASPPRFYYPGMTFEDGLVNGSQHNITAKLATPPESVIMLGSLHCGSVDGPYGAGTLLTQELVMVANLTEEKGKFHMTSDPAEWRRMEFDSWDLDTGAVVEYRINSPSEMQIQWASTGEWVSNPSSNLSQPVQQRLTYQVRFGIAEVQRQLPFPGCEYISNVKAQMLSIGIEPLSIGSKTTSSLHRWVELAMKYRVRTEGNKYGRDNGISERDVGETEKYPALLDGVSAFLRVMMSEILTGYPSSSCSFFVEEGRDIVNGSLCFEQTTRDGSGRTLSSNTQISGGSKAQSPFSPEAERIALSSRPLSDYPYFEGDFMQAVACKLQAAILFLIIGVVAIIVGLVRIMVGPAILTSWISQHVHLAQFGAITVTGAGEFTNGDKASNRKSMILRLDKHMAFDEDESEKERQFRPTSGWVRILPREPLM